MAVPDYELRGLIGYAAGRIQFGASNAQILAEMGPAFPNNDEAQIARAVHLARQYKSYADIADRFIHRAVPGKKFAAARALSEFFSPETQPTDTVGVRLSFEYEVRPGVTARASVVVNVPASTSITTMHARFCAALLSGHIAGPRSTYQPTRCVVNIIALTPYARDRGFALDVAPISKAHPNPYRPQ